MTSFIFKSYRGGETMLEKLTNVSNYGKLPLIFLDLCLPKFG